MTHALEDRVSRLPGFIRLSDYFPDPNLPAIPDIVSRNLLLEGSLESTHTSLAVNDAQTIAPGQRLWLRRVQVGDVTGGTVTVQVTVDGRDIFADATRPVSGGEAAFPTNHYVIQAGAVIKTVIEATSGAPTGEAGVIIDTQPLVFIPQSRARALRGKDRLRVSKRRAAKRSPIDARIEEIDAAFVARSVGGIGMDVPTRGTGDGGDSGGGGTAPGPGTPVRPPPVFSPGGPRRP